MVWGTVNMCQHQTVLTATDFQVKMSSWVIVPQTQERMFIGFTIVLWTVKTEYDDLYILEDM